MSVFAKYDKRRAGSFKYKGYTSLELKINFNSQIKKQ